ncbi:MAG: hypothetical protein LBH25_07790 [Fibromonadaceae bacterium]|jgi:hypothetical protein|nr:hypothetical protein [Fibromonadaceae bacterium]
MTLFQQLAFKITLLGTQAAFALQIDAPPEITGQILAYSKEAGVEKENAILKASVSKNATCNAFNLELIDYNGKAVKKIERCSNGSQNADLQNAVLEIFGHPVKNTKNSNLSGNTKTILMGTGMAITGLLLYCSKPPKPPYRGEKQ